jgi:hypothetical protein
MTATAEKPACTASERDGVMECARCGFAWPSADKQPRPCDPITFQHLGARMQDECSRAEISLAAVTNLATAGMPTDGGFDARRRLAELGAVLRLVERCAGDAQIKAILNGKKQ